MSKEAQQQGSTGVTKSVPAGSPEYQGTDQVKTGVYVVRQSNSIFVTPRVPIKKK